MFFGLLATAERRDIPHADVNHFPNRFASFDASDLVFNFVRDGLEVFEVVAEPALNDGAGLEQVDDSLVVVHGWRLTLVLWFGFSLLPRPYIYTGGWRLGDIVFGRLIGDYLETGDFARE